MLKNKKILIDWLAVILWLAIIFYFSSQPDLKSSLPNIWDTIFRKIAHMSEYFVLTYLFFRSLKNYRFPTKVIIASSAIVSAFYAMSDEFHQMFVAGRQGSIRDVFIDSVGILVAILFISYYNKNK